MQGDAALQARALALTREANAPGWIAAEIVAAWDRLPSELRTGGTGLQRRCSQILSQNRSCFAPIASRTSMSKASFGCFVVEEAEGFGIQRQVVERVPTASDVGAEEVER